MIMDYKLGLRTLKSQLPAEARAELYILEARLLDNLRRERLYGSTETTRAERSGVVDPLNQLAQAYLDVSFNDLCRMSHAPQSASLSGLRQRLALLDDAEIEALCLDHFPAVYDKFSRGLRRDEKVNLLLDHCRRRPDERARLAEFLPPVAAASPTVTTEKPGESPVRGIDRQSGPSPPEPTEIRRRYALLIGVSDYVDPSYRPLPHTIHDVTELAKVFEGAGYTVRTLHSGQTDLALKPTRENIWGEMASLAKQTGSGDLLLVHFGGHGDLDADNAAYLLPGNGRKAALQETAIDLDKFKQALAEAGAQAKILILDACHSGIGRDAAGMDAEFERHVYLEATGTATLSSCRRGEVAYEHDASPHGAFTYYLLEGMQGGAVQEGRRFVTFDDLKDYVTHAVKSWAIRNGRQQWPNASTQLVGDPPLIELTTPAENRPAHLPPNPFTDTFAIRDPARFVGREALLNRLLRLLEGGSVALVGDRKIGKSSLLHRLADRLRAEPGQRVISWDFFDPAFDGPCPPR